MLYEIERKIQFTDIFSKCADTNNAHYLLKLQF